MTIEVYFWKDGSVSVTRDGNPYNRWSEYDGDLGKGILIEEPEGGGEL